MANIKYTIGVKSGVNFENLLIDAGYTKAVLNQENVYFTVSETPDDAEFNSSVDVILRKSVADKIDFATNEVVHTSSTTPFNSEKVTDNKEEIKNLFKESLVGIYKQGQDIEINLVANPDKVSKITSFVVNKVSGLDTNVKLGPSAVDQHIVAFSVHGELKAEQLVISNMTYIDKNGVKQQTGPFALDINYSAAKKSNEAIPKYREKLNEKIQNWIDRGNKVNEWLLTKEKTSDTAEDFSQRAKISEAVTKLQELKR